MKTALSSAQLKRAKREVRARIRAERDAVPEARRSEMGARAVERLLGLPEVRSAGTVMAFWSFGSEVPTGPLISALHERGARLVLPRLVDGEIVPLGYAPGDPTTAAGFGAREPLEVAERVDPAVIDVVVTPAVAFDRSGTRVGYGGGYYDRFFRRATGSFRVGLAFALQLLTEELPAGHTDLRVHAVATEREVVRCLERSQPT